MLNLGMIITNERMIRKSKKQIIELTKIIE
jgi:hypothetical protein